MLYMRRFSHVCRTPLANFSSKRDGELLFKTQYSSDLPHTNKKLPCKRQIQETCMAHYTLYSSSKSCWQYKKHTTTSCFPSLFLFLVSSILFCLCMQDAISFLPSISLSFCQYFLFSSYTFHKWQGERCPLKVIAGLIKFPPTRREHENVIKEKRWELERINLRRRPSTPGPCPPISDEENEKNAREYWRKQKLNDRCGVVMETDPTLE